MRYITNQTFDFFGILVNVDIIDVDVTFQRFGHSRQHICQGAFARAADAHNADELARMRLERNGLNTNRFVFELVRHITHFERYRRVKLRVDHEIDHIAIEQRRYDFVSDRTAGAHQIGLVLQYRLPVQIKFCRAFCLEYEGVGTRNMHKMQVNSQILPMNPRRRANIVGL